MSRSRRALWGYATNLLFLVATAATGLVATPWLIAWLGRSRYGAYKALVGWSGYLTLLDLGLGGALAPMLARALGRGDAKALRDALATGLRAYVALTAAMLAVGLAMTPLVLAMVPGAAADLRWGWLALLVGFVPTAVAPLRTLAEARQRGYRVNLWITAQGLLTTGLMLALARSGWGLAGQGLATSIGILLVAAVLARDAIRLDRGALAGVLAARPDPAARRALWALAAPTFLLNLCGRVSLMTDYIICAGILDGEAVASLATTQTLTVQAVAVVQAIGGAAWAGLAELDARGDRATFNRRLVELTGVVAMVAIAGLGPIVAYNKHFFDLWMRGKSGASLAAYGGDAVVAVAAFNGLLLGLLSLWGWCFGGTGRQRLLLVPLAASAAINLAASIALTYRLGLVGPLLGTTAAFLAVNLWAMPMLLRATFGVRPSRLLGALAWPLAWGVPYVAALRWAAQSHRPWGWIGLGAEMGLAAAGFAALGFVAVLGPDDRAAWRLRLSALRPGGPGPGAASP